MNRPEPTQEQQDIIAAFQGSGNLVIEAGAGTGKTSTLKMAATADPRRRGLYIAYNRAIAQDAKASFPASVQCSTAHALAFATAGRQFRHRLNGPRVPAREVARILGITGPTKIGDSGLAPLAPVQVARLVSETVARFCRSADADITPWHAPRKPGLDDAGTYRDLGTLLVPLARKAWADITSQDGQLKFEHDHYLKIWQLSGPVLRADYLLLDECQPTGTQVLIPDGAWNAKRGITTPTQYVPIESLRPGDRVVSYDSKGLRLRITGSVVSDVRSRPYSGRLVTVQTPDGRVSRYTPEHKCMAAIGPALRGRHVVYLMQRGTSFRVGVTVGLHGHINAGPRTRLQEERGDCAWILSVHDSRGEALAAEALASWKFGLPQMRFRGTASQQADIDAFWSKVGDLTGNADSCLGEHGRSIAYPLWSRGPKTTLTSRPMIVRACNLLEGMTLADADAMVGRRSQRRAVGSGDLLPITIGCEFYDGLVWSLEVEGDHTYVADGLVTHNCQDANPVVLDVVTRQKGIQLVAVGDRSQAIYGWRGAVDAMDQFPADQHLSLSQSFRFGTAVAAEANKWLSVLSARIRLCGYDRISSKLAPLASPDATLCRTNAEAMAQAMASMDDGHSTAVVGGGREIRALAEAAVTLKAGTGTSHPELFAFQTWGEVQDYAEHDPAGSDLRVLVKLIDDHGPDVIMQMVDRLTDEHRAEAVISTAHKAKGREWESVKIAGDFREPKRDPEKPDEQPKVPPAEAMLAYVAVTRARLTLDRTGLAWVDSYAPAAS